MFCVRHLSSQSPEGTANKAQAAERENVRGRETLRELLRLTQGNPALMQIYILSGNLGYAINIVS